MVERLTQAPDVASGDPRKPPPEPTMDVDSALVGQLTRRGRADQIVCEPDRSGGLDCDPT